MILKQVEQLELLLDAAPGLGRQLPEKGEPYREPVPRRPVGSLLRTSPKQGQARA